MDIFLQYRNVIAKNIKAFRLAKKLSADDVAAVLVMSRSNYYKVESGEQSVKGEWLEPLASLFDVNVSAFFNTRKTVRVNKLESQMLEYFKEATEMEVQHWLGIVGIGYRRKLTDKQYRLIKELMNSFNEKYG